jgi:hypothetical protein
VGEEEIPDQIPDHRISLKRFETLAENLPPAAVTFFVDRVILADTS